MIPECGEELKHRTHLSKVFYSYVHAAQISKEFLVKHKRVAKRARVELSEGGDTVEDVSSDVGEP